MFLTISLAKSVLLGSNVSIFAQEDHYDDQDEHHDVEDTDPAEDHVWRSFVEWLADLQIDDASEARQWNNQRQHDSSDHLRDAFDCVSLHGNDDGEPRSTLESRKEIGIPAARVPTKHISTHDNCLEDEYAWHEYFGWDSIRHSSNYEHDGEC